MKTILVPTDFSKNADHALQYAINFAKKQKSKIVLMHAYHAIYTSPEVPLEFILEQTKVMAKESEKKLHLLVDKVKKSGVPCSAFKMFGIPVDCTIETAKKIKADLIIMGTQGASGVKEVIIGSNAASVISKSTCPVLTVPEKSKFSDLKEILYATDYHESDLPAINEILEIAKIFKANITLLHIAAGDYTTEYERELNKLFVKKMAGNVATKKMKYSLIFGADVEKKLEKYAKNNAIDLVAMSTRKRTVLEKLFGSSMAKKMAYHSSVPLLSFHHKKDSVVFI